MTLVIRSWLFFIGCSEYACGRKYVGLLLTLDIVMPNLFWHLLQSSEYLRKEGDAETSSA